MHCWEPDPIKPEILNLSFFLLKRLKFVGISSTIQQSNTNLSMGRGVEKPTIHPYQIINYFFNKKASAFSHNLKKALILCVFANFSLNQRSNCAKV